MISRLYKKALIFDAFPKVDSGYQQKTAQGGLVTTIVSICLWFLILSECREYLQVSQSFEFFVDQSINRQLQINVDITVNTRYLTVDLLDMAGERMHVANELKRVPTKFEVRTAHHVGEVIDRPLNVHQMVKDAAYNTDAFSPDRGAESDTSACRIFGTFEVNKVLGNLYITAYGHGYGFGLVHIDHDLMNFTHRIDKFSFGTHYPRLVNPLDNSIEISEAHSEIFSYYMSVVPTTYIDKNNRVLYTNQYSVTDYMHDAEKAQAGVPGIFFRYEIEPISVRITETYTSFSRFLVRLCGIVGGIWVTTGFVFRIVDGFWRNVMINNNKNDIDSFGKYN
ncbi:10170_t:CDS:2 [Ambispora leptoticha]|uniref:10170_t:CDS:1 n=1 Tax=Ambispora leptoticha TaxID=144679 RepID=A0A9N8ZG45_9GLOM|nr:10170_t:CDS:2 [Ambispora leptoticha]